MGVIEWRDCPEASSLEQLLLGQLPDLAAEALERHVERCDRCGRTLAVLLGEDSLVQVLRSHAGERRPDDSAVPGLIQRLKGLPATAGGMAPATVTEFPHGTPSSRIATRSQDPGPRPETAQQIEQLLAGPQGPEEIGRLGPYRLLERLGAGGMGAVYRAEDPQLQRQVALKVMLPSLAGSATARERFLREARAMAALEHDHIVPVYQVGEDRGVLFLAMPLLKGETLEDRLRRQGRLPLPEALRIAREAAAGLAAAHERRLIHRDIKPSNLWLEGPAGRVKILDFGLAQPVDAAGHLTISGVVIGTPQYMAPEQASGTAIEARSDLFSLGCVLYRMTTGELPFQGTSAMKVLRAVELDEPRPPREAAPELPVALSDLILQLLAKQPASRPPSARRLIEMLDSLDLGPTGAPQERPLAQGAGANLHEAETLPGLPPSPVRPRRRRPVLAVVVLGVLGLVGSGAGIVFYRATKEVNGHGTVERPGLPAVATDAPAEEPAGELRVLQGHMEAVGPIVCTPDGRRALTGSWDGTLRLWDLESGAELRSFQGHIGWVWALAFAPDGRRALSAGGGVDKTVCLWDLEQGREVVRLRGFGPVRFLGVAFVPQGLWAVSDGGGDDNTLRLWDVDPGNELRSFPGHTDRVLRVALAADGARLLSGSRDTTLRLWDAATGAPLRTFAGHTAAVTAVALAPDGSRALSGSEDGTARLWDVGTGQEWHRLEGHAGGVEAVAFSPDGRRALTGGRDQMLRLWDCETGKELCRLEGHTGLIGGVAFTPDGRKALSAGADKTIRLWRLPR
jgi:serine/threonine protein kinase